MAEPLFHEPDAETVVRLRAGDITALAAVFRACGPRVYRLCRRMLGNAPDAEDATQEIFLRAYERAATFDGRARFSTWLHRLAVHHCLNRLKQRRRHETALQQGVTTAQPKRAASLPEAALLSEDAAARVDAWLDALPPHYRACFVLREVEELSYAEIADLLEIPVGTVMSRLSRARRMLRARAATELEK